MFDASQLIVVLLFILIIHIVQIGERQLVNGKVEVDQRLQFLLCSQHIKRHVMRDIDQLLFCCQLSTRLNCLFGSCSSGIHIWTLFDWSLKD